MVAWFLSGVSDHLYVSDLEVHSHETLFLHHCERECNANISLCAHHQDGYLAD